MTIAGRLTLYRIWRDHDTETRFFPICVPEAQQYGFGFQFGFRGAVYGISVHTRQRTVPS